MGRRAWGDEKVVEVRLRDKCLRCGTCCKNNPPTLHIDDISILENKIISYGDLITYRRGELAYDNINNKVIKLTEEIVKIRSKEGDKACIFYDDLTNSCTIYEFRPMECRKLKCWDNEEFLQIYEQNRLSRFQIVKKDSAMGEIIENHEEQTSIDNVLKLFYQYKDTKDKTVREKINSIILYDESVRDFIKDKTGATKELDFFFGRPILQILKTIGW